MEKIKIDLNNQEFQNNFFNLEKQEQTALIKTLKIIHELEWNTLYKSKGLRWEMISSKKTPAGQPIYYFRFSKKYRALALRDQEFLRILSLHVDHDGAYHQ